jgi:probable rRNA maturation factor
MTDFKLIGWRNVVKVIKKVIEKESKIPGDLNFIVTNDETLREFNIRFLGHNHNTDVITFNYNEGNVINGEIYISIDTVRGNSLNYNISLKCEVIRVFIHGVLHLLGYDDKSEEQKEKMRNMEDFWISEFEQ